MKKIIIFRCAGGCFLGLLVTLLCLTSWESLSLAAEHTQADVVWAKSDGLRYELFSSSLKNGNWSQPEQVTNDNADNLHPCIDMGPDGRKWLAWTAMEQGSYEIRYAVFKNGQWSDPKKLPSDLKSNISPSLVVDDGNVTWMVWAGNDGVHNDDIYFSRFIHGKWQKPARVNQANNVPDILPRIELMAPHGYQVIWQGFRKNGYVKLVSRWTGHGWGPEHIYRNDASATKAKNRNRQEIKPPKFVPQTRQMFLRTY